MSADWSQPRRRRDAAVDPGLQAERTAMAWQRTVLGIGGVSALLLHLADGNPWAAAPGGLGLLVALALLVLVEKRYERTVRQLSDGRAWAGPRLIRAVAASAVALAVGALVLTVVRTG